MVKTVGCGPANESSILSHHPNYERITMKKFRQKVADILDNWNPTKIGPILATIIVVGVILYGANT